MPKKNLNKKNSVYFNILREFAYSETKEATNAMYEHLRELDELPMSIKIEKSPLNLIRKYQANLKKIFKDLYDGESLDEMSELSDFMFCYYAFFNSYVEINGEVLQPDPIHLFYEEFPPDAILSLCLVQLLKTNVREHIYKCKLCKKYFYSIKYDDDNIKYCPGYCRTKNKMSPEDRSKYDKDIRAIHKKNNDLRRKRERIEKIMITRNCTKEEAEQYYIQEQGIDLTTE